MQKQDTKNKFGSLGFAVDDDSEEEIQAMKTKTAKKKEQSKSSGLILEKCLSIPACETFTLKEGSATHQLIV